jgi:3'-phosphoadenosine 5'-phosphosulfate sulfotransferase (PAPS reductase)/FAD synthetase
MIDHMPDLACYDWIVVNSSGGKDSQTALEGIVRAADRQSVDRSRIVVNHQCLGAQEWPGTLDLVRRQAAHYGLRVEVASYRDKDGAAPTLLDYVRKRGKWPSSKQRFCTSEFKRGPGGRVLTKLAREVQGPCKILSVFGFRAEESAARAKRQRFSLNTRHSTNTRQVWDYLPIHDWTEEQVWQDIKTSGVPYHTVYDQGMKRLSCTYCIFAPRNALLTAAYLRPDMLQEYVDLEREIGHDFQHNKPIRLIQEAMLAGEKPKEDTEKWRM